MDKMKTTDRLRKILKIQKENNIFSKRLERVKPVFSVKGCEEWYKHHILFKEVVILFLNSVIL